MARSLFQCYFHIIFSTKNRSVWFADEQIRDEMFSYLAGACGKMGCPAVIVGGHHNHVHILVRMAKTVLAPKLIGEIKEDSSKWLKTKGDFYHRFYWQTGYGCFSLSASHVEPVKAYIANQEEHHQRVEFKDEYLQMLTRNNVEFDERYLWD